MLQRATAALADRDAELAARLRQQEEEHTALLYAVERRHQRELAPRGTPGARQAGGGVFWGLRSSPAAVRGSVGCLFAASYPTMLSLGWEGLSSHFTPTLGDTRGQSGRPMNEP